MSELTNEKSFEEAIFEEATQQIEGKRYLLRRAPWGTLSKLNDIVVGLKDGKDKRVFNIYGTKMPVSLVTSNTHCKPYVNIRLEIREGNDPVKVLKNIVALLGGTFSRDENPYSTQVTWEWLSRDASRVEEQIVRVIIASGAPPSCKIVETTDEVQLPDAYVGPDGRIMTKVTSRALDCTNDMEVSE